MTYYPKKQPKKATVISVILYVIAAVMFVVGNFVTPKLAWQLIGLVLISIGIFFTSRYILTDYKYVIKDIERTGEEMKLTIIKINGSREAIMANFNLADAYALQKCKKLSDFEKKNGKVNKFYGYCSNFSSPDTHILAIEFNQTKVAFAIELSDEFAHELDSRITKKENA